jgi:FkbM family methyltransferase
MSLSEIKKRFAAGEITKSTYIDQMHELHRSLFDYSRFLRHTDIAKIEITDELVVMTSRATGVKIICDSDDKRIAPIEIINFGFYEKDEYSMIMRMVGENDVIFDIGANVGWYSINIAAAYPSSTVFAFEPIPKTFDYLVRNIHLNGVHNVRAQNIGLSNQEGVLTFFYYPTGSGNASSANLTDAVGVEEIKCHVSTLDRFASVQAPRVDFIKCDVEGAELLVFQGGLDVLRRFRPIVFTEMLRKWSAKFDYHPNEIIELFLKMGYRCFIAKQEGLVEFLSMDDETQETNFFFLHSTHTEKFAEILQGTSKRNQE